MNKGYLDDAPLRHTGSPSKHLNCAHFPGTGPTGKTCFSCQFLEIEKGYKVPKNMAPCLKFKELTEKMGQKIPAKTAACKYYEKRT